MVGKRVILTSHRCHFRSDRRSEPGPAVDLAPTAKSHLHLQTTRGGLSMNCWHRHQWRMYSQFLLKELIMSNVTLLEWPICGRWRVDLKRSWCPHFLALRTFLLCLFVRLAQNPRGNVESISRGKSAMSEGQRKRRFSQNLARRRWYALHRARRFLRRYGLVPVEQLRAGLLATSTPRSTSR